ncbi:carnitine 3-dehydrogenase [Desulfitispora alkaliphila]|uniref:3-hydroxyacyl-CoA dehydrogenase NAD-binding domain-containing protein n=1 Tax=Desulfitispora alkaliphila TaxID=622674 RepID=UPI003D1DA8C8
MTKDIKKIAVIGTGVIGNGWISRFLAHGYEVTAFDLDPNAYEKTKVAVDSAWPYLEKMELAQGANPRKIRFEDSIEKTVKEADYIQENVPEQTELKKKILSEIDKHAKKTAIIGSSTSGIKPSVLQEKLKNPQRFIVAHPFNPVYLLPLVEIVGGSSTSKDTIDASSKFFKDISMKPLIVKKEIEGHIADRLMEALWREALHLVNDGVATTEEIDDAITYGAGLRWAQMGPFLTFHLAGGDQGMRHMLRQFGPALKLPWTKLEAPELTEELKEKIITGCEENAGDATIKDLENKRDHFLVNVQNLISQYN